MDRRSLLKFLSVGAVTATGSGYLWHKRESTLNDGLIDLPAISNSGSAPTLPLSPIYEDMLASPVDMIEMVQHMTTPAPNAARFLAQLKATSNAAEVTQTVQSGSLKHYLLKMKNFESSHQEDVFLDENHYTLLVNVYKRLDRVQNLVGHGNFNVISFDEMQAYGRHYASIGSFPKAELSFIEEVFSDNASRYGFFGEKITKNLTSVIKKRDRVKVNHTGHYLFRGDSEKLYAKVKKDLGGKVFLTSGIRSIVKQSHLFLAKTIQSKGNLSRASRSLAPPGHSFHGIGDFDVGKVGFGIKNFTTEFAQTEEFKRLVDLGYVNMRYPKGNLLGVRYEPWHIKVV